MPILKIKKNKNYTVISNDILRNRNLSWKAKGMLCYMLSCDDSWKFSIRGLAEMSSDGISAVSSTLKELEDAGYYKKEKIYENGKIKEWVYYISETPIYIENS